MRRLLAKEEVALSMRRIILLLAVAAMLAVMMVMAATAFAISDQGKNAYCEHAAGKGPKGGPPGVNCVT